MTAQQIAGMKLDCGPDAQNHPVVIEKGIPRFKSDPATLACFRLAGGKILDIWDRLDMEHQDHRLSIRRFYRDIGYTLCGYLEIFEEQLKAEHEAARP